MGERACQHECVWCLVERLKAAVGDAKTLSWKLAEIESKLHTARVEAMNALPREQEVARG